MARFTTERGFDRLVNFSDATVAIALTLLVLPLTDLAGEAHRVGAGTLLVEHFSAIFAFFLSFVVIAVIWYEHHRLFESLVDYDLPLLMLNFVWLLAVVALPFSTEANQQSSSDDRVSLALYIGNLLLSFVAIAAMRVAALRDPHIIHADRRADFRLGPSIALVGLGTIALILAVSVPVIGMWSLFLLTLTGRVSRLLRRVRGSR
ncbi:MAG TPA: TMEM175 family protein [Gryllotalpicola sp.]